MKIVFLILTILATVVAEHFGSFYANVEGTWKPISDMDVIEYQCLVVRYNNKSAESYLFNEGIISTKNSQTEHYFSIANGYLIFGRQDDLKPYNVELDYKSKIVNIDAYLCKMAGKKYAILLPRDRSSRFMSCSSVDLYFLSPEEAEQLKISNKRKREIKHVPGQVAEEMGSPTLSETRASKIRSFVVTGPPTPGQDLYEYAANMAIVTASESKPKRIHMLESCFGG